MFCTQYKATIQHQTKTLQEQAALLNAVDHVMAVIEFDLTGKILIANENFLKTVGYQLSEVKGQYHGIFIDPTYARSQEYQEFWQKLGRGEFVAGRFKRIAKSGETIWLEASYNPILDDAGRPYKIVKFATDITAKVDAEVEARAQIDAIGNVMATIEFDPTGKILTANANFLKTMGYTLDEIKGKHHGIFAVGDLASTQEYKAFWQKLRSGSFIAGTFDRQDKNGKIIWLEASYNPILNSDGEVYKVIKYATDIGSNQNSMLLDTVIEDVSSVILAMAGGDLTVAMKNHINSNEANMYDENINKLSGALKELSFKLKSVINDALTTSNIVSTISKEVAQGAQDLSQRVQEQGASLEETSATMNEMNSQVQSNTANAQEATVVSQEVQTKANLGVDVMQQTINAMNEIEQSSHKISDIVSLIDGIAFQTNLLALNAAVEAARAGERGRGFAVVAGEVRNLAQKSAEAAKDIKRLIDETVNRVTQGSKLASESGAMLTSINESINSVTQRITQIAQASTEQAAGVHQMHQAISQIDQVTQQNAALVEETSAAAESLNDQAEVLTRDMSYFRTGSSVDPASHSNKVPSPIMALPNSADTHSAEQKKESNFVEFKDSTNKIDPDAEKWGEF